MIGQDIYTLPIFNTKHMTSLKDILHQQIVDKTLSSHRSWLGKRVRVIDNKGFEWFGNLTYLGASVDKNVLQATVGSTPIFPIELHNVILIS